MVNTTTGAKEVRDSYSLRRQTLLANIPYFTTIAAALAACDALEAAQGEPRAREVAAGVGERRAALAPESPCAARKYPLEPLARCVRARWRPPRAPSRRRCALREQAEQARERSNRKAGEDAEARAKATRDAERSALERGELRAADLGAPKCGAPAYGERAENERRVANASSRAQAARDAEGVPRDGVTNARGDEAVVERDRARWDDAERKRAEAKEEEAASEGS